MNPAWIVCLVLSWFILQVGSGVAGGPASVSGDYERSIPWLDLTDLAEWKQGRGMANPVHRATTALPDDSVIRLDSTLEGGMSLVHRPGAGLSPIGPIQQHRVLDGMVLDASPLSGDRIGVLLYDMSEQSPTHGCLVIWVGTLDDLLSSREGSYTVKLTDTDSEIPIRGEIHRNLESSVFRVRADFDGDVPRRFQSVLTMMELDERVPTRGYDIPTLDLDSLTTGHVVVDREPGQYLGHPTTVLLEDGKTILCVYPRGHGRGGVVYKRSLDGGLTWSERLPTPSSWEGSQEVPTLHRVVDLESGKKRLIMWSGLFPARLSVSEDDGETFSPLKAVGDWGGIVVMGFVEQLVDGRYLAMFHDDGRFISEDNRQTDPVTFTLYSTLSEDGGRSWSAPQAVWSGQDLHLCEPGVVRSPDGDTLAILLRENSRRRNSHVMFSEDEGATWSAPRELPASLTGDRHTAVYSPDGRLFISFRDTTLESPTKGDWVGWVGTWDDIRYGLPGDYRVRLKDNKHAWDTAYPGVEMLPDGTIVATTYGHWDEGEPPYIRSVRLKLETLDQMKPMTSD